MRFLSATECPADVIKAVQNFLGWGYRGYDLYADPDCCTHALFDLADMGAVEVQEAPSYEGSFLSADDTQEFFKKLSANVSLGGEYGGFSLEVTSNFSGDVLKKGRHQFAQSRHCIVYYRLAVRDSAHLRAEVQHAIETMEPSQLFDEYGTHYLKSIYIGGRISFTTCVDTSSVTKNFDIKATTEAAFAKLLKPGKGGGEEVNKDDIEQVLKNKKLKVLGGNPAKAHDVINGAGDPAATYSAWSESIRPDFISISDFARGGVVPLYELATGTRGDVLRNAWNDFMRKHTDLALLSQDEVRYGDLFYLKDQDGNYVAPAVDVKAGKEPFAPDHVVTYPTVAREGRVPLKFSGGTFGDPVKAGEIVKLFNMEPRELNAILTVVPIPPVRFSITWFVKGKVREDDTHGWTIRKLNEDVSSYQPVCYGERVQILSNEPDARKQRLYKCPVKDAPPLTEMMDGRDVTLRLIKEDLGYWILEKVT